MRATLIVVIAVSITAFLTGCVASVSPDLPLEEMPQITVATAFTLIASPSHPTSIITDNSIQAGERVSVVGSDEDAAWLLVLHEDRLGWIPSLYSRTNVGTLQPAIVLRPLSAECTDFAGAISEPGENWISRVGGSAVILGSVYLPQGSEQFKNASIALEIDGSGSPTSSDYVHIPLTNSSSVVLFAYAIDGLLKGSSLSLALTNPSEVPLSFQAAIFSDDCPEKRPTRSGDANRLPIGRQKTSPANSGSTASTSPYSPAQAVSPGIVNIESGTESRVLLDLSKYSVGEPADRYGRNLIVGQNDDQKFLTGLNDSGRVSLQGLDLSEHFEITFEADWNDGKQTVILRSDTGNELTVLFDDEITFSDTSMRWDDAGWQSGDTFNRIRLKVSGNTAKLFVNSQYFGTIRIDPSIIFTAFSINGIDTNDRLSSINIWVEGDGPDQNQREPFRVITTTLELDLSRYEVGDLADEMGLDLLIREGSGRKYVSSLAGNGRILLDNLQLAGDFEIEYEADWNENWPLVSLHVPSGAQIAIIGDDGQIEFGATRLKWESTGWEGGNTINQVLLLVRDGVARLFFNDRFYASQTVDPAAVFTSLGILGIGKDDRLFSLDIVTHQPEPIVVEGKSASIITPSPEESDQRCVASYPTQLRVGDRASVSIGYLLNLRSQPTTRQENIVGQAQSGEIVSVLAGPECAQDMIWWYIETVRGNAGWMSEGSAEDYFLAPFTSEAATNVTLAVTSVLPSDEPERQGCASKAGGVFQSIWSKYESHLGCPQDLSPVSGFWAEQLFQNGHMYWSKDLKIYLVTIGGNSGSWRRFPEDESTWKSGMPEKSCEVSVPAGLVQPIRGFGGLWCPYQGIREQIGWGVDSEHGFQDGVDLYQRFDKGVIFRDSDGMTKGMAYVLLYEDGSFVREAY